MDDFDKQIQRFYNDIAQKFSDEWYSNESLFPVLEKYISLLNPNPRVLDLGCGAGYESMRLSKLGANVVGVDYSLEPIKIARERNPDCQFEVMDFRKLDNSLEYFDGIVAIASLIHIKDDELNLVFKNMRNIIKLKGLVMTIVVEGEGICKERSNIEIDGIEYNRPFYLHTKTRLTEIAENENLKYFDQLPLANELNSYGWKCFLLQAQ